MGVIAEVASFGMQRAQGDIIRGEANVQAKSEELAGKQREVDRKDRLAEALASQNASAGAGGIAAFEGSPLTIMNQDIQAEETATQRDKFQTDLRAMTLRAGGKVARIQKRTGANIGLLTDVEDRLTDSAKTGG